MKLISLNTWGCRVEKLIFEYIREQAGDTDIFCFQEILKGGKGKTTREEIKSAYEDIAKLLPNYVGYFRGYTNSRYYDGSFKDFDFEFGIATFVRSNLASTLIDGTDLYNYQKEWSDYSGRFAAGTALAVKAGDYIVVNVHGLWQGSIKVDTEAKIEQSKKIISLSQKAHGNKVICGDFNLLPDTQSLKMLGDKYNDLVREYKITDTRGALYLKNLKYSDYAFTDKNITVTNFSVPKISISDHLPLVLEFD